MLHRDPVVLLIQFFNDICNCTLNGSIPTFADDNALSY